MSDKHESEAMTWTLGDRLRKARRVAGFSTEEMGKRVGVSRQAINSYELDARSPKLPTLLKWAEETGAPFDWVCRGEPPTMRLMTMPGALVAA